MKAIVLVVALLCAFASTAVFAAEEGVVAEAGAAVSVQVEDADTFSDELEVDASDALSAEDEAAEAADDENVDALTYVRPCPVWLCLFPPSDSDSDIVHLCCL